MAALTMARAWPGLARRWEWVIETRRRRATAAFVFFLLATLAWFAPLIAHLDGAVLIGPADSTLSIRSYWAVAQQHGDPFTFTHDYLNGAPEGIPWYWAVEIAQPVQTGVTWALHPLFGFIGGFNIFLLSGVVLTGFFAFVLFDRLGYDPLVSLFGAYVLSFNPWIFMRAFAGHAAFLHVWIFIAMICCFLEMSSTRKVRWAALAGLCFGGTFLISSYFGLLGTLVFALYFVFEFFRVHGWEEKLWTATLATVGSAVLGVCLLPAAIAYHLDHSTVLRSISNGQTELQRLGADTAAYLLPARNHPVFGPITRHFTSSENFAEQTLFYGYTTMALAAIGIVLVLKRHPVTFDGWMRRTALVFSAILLPLAYWASLKRVFHVFGVPLPALSFFMGHVTTFFRVYARFGVIVGVALVLLAAPTLQLIVRRYRRGPLIVVALWVLVAFELLPGRVSAWTGASNPPAYDRWIATQPAGIVVHYPLPTDQEPAIHLGEREVFYQMYSKHPLFNIFGAGTGNTREDAIRILARYITDPNTPAILAAEHVKYVFVHDEVYRQEHVEPPTVSNANFAFVRRFGPVRVYKLKPSVRAADLSSLLEQNAAEIGLVEGLKTPTVTYGGVTAPDAGGWSKFGDGATITLHNEDPNLVRMQLIVHLKAAGPNGGIQLADSSGAVVSSSAVGTQDTQVTLGPFAVGMGNTTYTLKVPSGGPLSIGPVLIQPLADYSISLANEH